MARLAVVGLTIGLVALAALALFSTGSTARATTWVREVGQISDHWGQVFLNVNVESDAHNKSLQLTATVIFAIDFLLLAVCGFVLLSHQRRIERQAQESRHQALHDGLTGIANRVLLVDRIEQALRAADRHNEQVGLLL